MPSKSEYIEAPISLETFRDSLKAHLSTVGFQHTQENDDDEVFESDYWVAKQTSSTKNLVPESEVLVNQFEGWGDEPKGSLDGNEYSFVTGAEFFVTKNTDPAQPFKLVSHIIPRVGEKDLWLAFRKEGLKPNTDYTISFYAKKYDANSEGKVRLALGRNNPLPENIVPRTSVGDIADTWQRFSISGRTDSTTLRLGIAGWNSWGYSTVENLNRYSEDLGSWGNGGSIPSVYDTSKGTPPSINGYGGRPLRASYSSLSAIYNDSEYLGNLTGRTFTFSVWAYVVSGSPWIDLGDTRTTLDTIGEWKRYSITRTYTSGSGSIRSHMSGNSGDVVYLWGAQLSETNGVIEYRPNPYSTPISGCVTGGGISISGLQIEEGLTPTTYEPVRKSFLIPNEKTYSGKLNNQLLVLNSFIPGAHSVFLSIKQNKFGNSYRTGISVFSEENFFNNTSRETSNLSSMGAVRREKVYGSGTFNIYTNYIQHVYTYNNSNGLRMNLGKGSDSGVYPFGNVTWILGHLEGDKTEYSYDYDFTLYGVVFTPATPENTNRARKGYGFIQETPGNGRKKLMCASLEDDGTNINLSMLTPGWQINQDLGVAKSDGFFKVTVNKLQNTTVLNDRGYIHYSTGNLNIYQTKSYYFFTSINKNTDTFAFTQGSAEGFLYTLNQNSNFFFRYMQADLVNSPNSSDDGTQFTRFAVGRVPSYKDSNTDIITWYAHGPYVKSNYSVNFGNTFRILDSYWTHKLTSSLPELLGDDVKDSGFYDSIIYQQYLTFSSWNVLSNRGMAKNFFYVPEENFQGQEGDYILAEDGTRYFVFLKSSGYGSGNKYSSMVKV